MGEGIGVVGGLLDARTDALMDARLDALARGAVMALTAVNDPRSEGDERLRRRERLLHQLAMERQRRQRRPVRSA